MLFIVTSFKTTFHLDIFSLITNNVMFLGRLFYFNFNRPQTYKSQESLLVDVGKQKMKTSKSGLK